jgi:hypothetical protein
MRYDRVQQYDRVGDHWGQTLSTRELAERIFRHWYGHDDDAPVDNWENRRRSHLPAR